MKRIECLYDITNFPINFLNSERERLGLVIVTFASPLVILRRNDRRGIASSLMTKLLDLLFVKSEVENIRVSNKTESDESLGRRADRGGNCLDLLT
ncbi:hypothetical protein EVAR_26799_1 [Eumeta japonica]|uniref:Uncharacterized protein n=1 Tax=Eumeta variegata TaxID=151549 RepID=A0A4C1WDC0_EUMVA|nr:hypothetical protein EVAR_26799_1 [Eumeta japonica]